MSERRVVQQMCQHVAEGAMMARTAGHADAIYLPDVLEVIDTLTHRAEAAEAECNELRKLRRPMRLKELETECEALRKDAERLDYLDTVRDPYSRRPMREVIGTEWSIVFTHPATHTPTIREAIDTALAVQPTTGEEA